jgi:hypothetical protein
MGNAYKTAGRKAIRNKALGSMILKWNLNK